MKEEKNYDILWGIGFALPLTVLFIGSMLWIEKDYIRQGIICGADELSFLPIVLFIAMSIQDKKILKLKRDYLLEATASLTLSYICILTTLIIGIGDISGNVLVQLGITMGTKMIETHYIFMIFTFLSLCIAIVIDNTYLAMIPPLLMLISLVTFRYTWPIILFLLMLSLISILTMYKRKGFQTIKISNSDH